MQLRKLRKEELKKQGKVEAEFSEVTVVDLISTFGVTKDHMLQAAKILETEGNTKNWEILQPDHLAIMDLQTMIKEQIKTIKKFCLFKQVVPKA